MTQETPTNESSDREADEHMQRRKAFLDDLVVLCRKHRCMLGPDYSMWEDIHENFLPPFEEIDLGQQITWVATLGDVEEHLRLSLFDELHGVNDVT